MNRLFDVYIRQDEEGVAFVNLYLPPENGTDYHGLSPEDAEQLALRLIATAAEAKKTRK